MKIYLPHSRNLPSHRLHVTPGQKASAADSRSYKTRVTADWAIAPDGEPIMFTVQFIFGVAEDVEDNLAQWLVDTGQASKTFLILDR